MKNLKKKATFLIKGLLLVWICRKASTFSYFRVLTFGLFSFQHIKGVDFLGFTFGS